MTMPPELPTEHDLPRHVLVAVLVAGAFAWLGWIVAIVLLVRGAR